MVDDDAVEVCNDDEPNLETTGAAGARACARARAATTGCVPPIDWSATRSDVNEAKALDDGSEVISSYVTRRWRLGKKVEEYVTVQRRGPRVMLILGDSCLLRRPTLFRKVESAFFQISHLEVIVFIGINRREAT